MTTSSDPERTTGPFDLSSTPIHLDTGAGAENPAVPLANFGFDQAEMSAFSKVEMSAFSSRPRYPRHGDSEHELRGVGSRARHRAGDREASDAG
jgi:hypothetical protein